MAGLAKTTRNYIVDDKFIYPCDLGGVMSPRGMLGLALIIAVLLFAPILTIWLIDYIFGTSIGVTLVSYILILAIYILVSIFIGLGAWLAAKVAK